MTTAPSVDFLALETYNGTKCRLYIAEEERWVGGWISAISNECIRVATSEHATLVPGHGYKLELGGGSETVQLSVLYTGAAMGKASFRIVQAREQVRRAERKKVLGVKAIVRTSEVEATFTVDDISETGVGIFGSIAFVPQASVRLNISVSFGTLTLDARVVRCIPKFDAGGYLLGLEISKMSPANEQLWTRLLAQ